jgi:hypothetical protein
MRTHLRGRLRPFGAITPYPLEELYRELAFIAYHFHWPLAELLQLDHGERRRWCAEISAINEQLNGAHGDQSL